MGAMKLSQASWSSARYGALPKLLAQAAAAGAAGEQEEAIHSTGQENNAQRDPFGGSEDVIDKALRRICSPKTSSPDSRATGNQIT